LNASADFSIQGVTGKKITVLIVSYVSALSLGIAGLLQTFRAMELARGREPQRDDYCLRSGGDFWFAMMFLAAFLVLLFPFFSHVKLPWKVIGSFTGIAIYLGMLKLAAMIALATGVVHP
jgi:hypothetical protein